MNRDQVVKQRGQEWAAAELRGDTTVLGQILAEDFVAVGPFGFLLTKEQWLARYTSGDLKHSSFVWDDVTARIYGDSAVVTGRQTMTGMHKDREIGGRFRVTQVFVQQEERWLLVALHLSPIAERA